VAKHYGPVRADYSSVTRLVKQIPEAVLVRFRDGFDRYNDRCLPAMRRNYYRYRPNQIWVIDHHVLDMVTIHNGKLYRPWLTAIADLRSRKVMGWCLSYNPCTLTILEALGMAIEANGNRAPQTMLLDNGKDMRSFLLNGRGQWIPSQADGMTEAEMVHFSGAFEQLGIEVQFSQPYHGQSKPIERWFRTLIEEFVKGFGTYVGSNTTSKPEESKLFWRALNGSRKKTVHVTIDLVRETAAWWIPEWNNTWKHRGHGMEGRTPEAVWKIDQIQNPVILDSSLSLILETEQTMCTVYKNGIKIDKIEYYAPELMEYQGQKVRVRRLFKDMSRVLVYKLAGDTYICEAAADALMETGVTKDDVASVKRAHKAVRKLEDQYREAMERGNSHLSHQEQLILIAEKRTSAGGGNRTDVEERKVSGNPIPFPRPSKLKTGNPILDRQPE
jgi:putative transposase